MNKRTKETTRDVIELLGWMMIGIVLLGVFWVAASHAAPPPRAPACECIYNFQNGNSVQVTPQLTCEAPVVQPPDCPPVQPQITVPIVSECRHCRSDRNGILLCRGCSVQALMPVQP